MRTLTLMLWIAAALVTLAPIGCATDAPAERVYLCNSLRYCDGYWHYAPWLEYRSEAETAEVAADKLMGPCQAESCDDGTSPSCVVVCRDVP